MMAEQFLAFNWFFINRGTVCYCCSRRKAHVYRVQPAFNTCITETILWILCLNLHSQQLQSILKYDKYWTLHFLLIFAIYFFGTAIFQNIFNIYHEKICALPSIKNPTLIFFFYSSHCLPMNEKVNVQANGMNHSAKLHYTFPLHIRQLQN